MRVIVASPLWSLNGVNIFSATLLRGLRLRGVDAHILLTNPPRHDTKPLPRPQDIPMIELPVASYASWAVRWQAMIDYLEAQAPCIYLPNHDWLHACVSPSLSSRVGIVGIVHSDDPEHYEQLTRLGAYWNAVVAVSDLIATQIARGRGDGSSPPELGGIEGGRKVVTIPYGVDLAAQLPVRSQRRLRLIYAGRWVQAQKRILDLPKIVTALVQRAVPVQLTIVGNGWDKSRLIAASQPHLASGTIQLLDTQPPERIRQLFEQSDVFLLPSEFEGLPLALLEAMGQGCIPVVSDIRSGIPQLIEDGVNGYRVPIGDIATFAERLAYLEQHPAVRQEMGQQAYKSLHGSPYQTQVMVDSYWELLKNVWTALTDGTYRRPAGPILPPPSNIWTWRDRLPSIIRASWDAYRRFNYARRFSSSYLSSTLRNFCA
jgi:glycosyltransferase involved in cell wall biosynthesis